MLISGIQQSNSVIHIYIYIVFFIKDYYKILNKVPYANIVVLKSILTGINKATLAFF